jgi:two-component system, LytTR family, sensor kinase
MKKSLLTKERKEFLIRTIVISLGALFLLYSFKLIVLPFEIPMNPWALAILYVLGVNVASEGNLLIDKYLNKKMSWHLLPKKRIWLQLGLTISWTAFMTVVPFSLRLLIIEKQIPDNHFLVFALFTFIFGAFLLILYNAITIGVTFFKEWKDSLLENERLRREKLVTDYKLLQDQLNPHFLFNNFNVLISEISHNPETAIEFTRRLSQVYRYVLQSRKNDIVLLKEELELINSFYFLHKVRVGDALQLVSEIDNNSLEKYLPPLTIQILFENALKHNIVSQEKPLSISIKSVDDNCLKISNNLQHKECINSTRTGLSNIMDRYLLLGKKNIFIEKTEDEFCVTIPLLDK